ncbi:MAG: hypothetical protein P8Y13_12985 [Deinococcales bacterium]
MLDQEVGDGLAGEPLGSELVLADPEQRREVGVGLAGQLGHRSAVGGRGALRRCEALGRARAVRERHRCHQDGGERQAEGEGTGLDHGELLVVGRRPQAGP